MGRTTLRLEDDALVAAQELARREGLSLGAAVSALVLRGARTAEEARLPRTSPFSQLGRRSGRTITSEDVYRIMDEEGI